MKIKIKRLKERRGIKIDNKIIPKNREETSLEIIPMMNIKEIGLREKKELIMLLSNRDKGLKNDMKSKRTQISRKTNKSK
jgi:hypothetical protein